MITHRDEDISATNRALRHEMQARGWTVEQPSNTAGLMLITRPDGSELMIFGGAPYSTSHAAAKMARDKFATHNLLLKKNLPSPDTTFFIDEDHFKAGIESYIEQHGRIVIKPLDSAHGNGVTTNVTTLDDALGAYQAAHYFSDSVLAQEDLGERVDLRLLCIDYKCVAAAIRIPARVYGDGEHTVGELIDIENQDPRRGEGYRRNLTFINRERAERYLGEAFNSVPEAGAEVRVLGTANLGTGGETVDITDDLPSWLKELTEAATKAIHLPVSGVDIMTLVPPRPDATREELDPRVTEVNSAPSIGLHETPTFGEGRPTIKMYVDYLATLPALAIK